MKRICFIFSCSTISAECTKFFAQQDLSCKIELYLFAKSWHTFILAWHLFSVRMCIQQVNFIGFNKAFLAVNTM